MRVGSDETKGRRFVTGLCLFLQLVVMLYAVGGVVSFPDRQKIAWSKPSQCVLKLLSMIPHLVRRMSLVFVLHIVFVMVSILCADKKFASFRSVVASHPSNRKQTTKQEFNVVGFSQCSGSRMHKRLKISHPFRHSQHLICSISPRVLLGRTPVGGLCNVFGVVFTWRCHTINARSLFPCTIDKKCSLKKSPKRSVPSRH